MEELSTFILSSVMITLFPGPDIFMVISYSLQKGVKSSIKFIMGLIIGLLFHSLVLVLGWSNFFSNSEIIIFDIK